jgi:hypothetical protein
VAGLTVSLLATVVGAVVGVAVEVGVGVMVGVTVEVGVGVMVGDMVAVAVRVGRFVGIVGTVVGTCARDEVGPNRLAIIKMT